MVAAKRLTERNRQLGRALREARIRADFSRQTDVAKRIGSSQPTLARIENGTRPPTDAELTALLDLYQPDNRAEIEKLARPNDTGGLALNGDFHAILGLAEEATAIRTFTSERIPMTLQSDLYALKQYALFDKSIPPTDVLLLHARRADLLTREPPPIVEAVMSVSSLLRVPGGQDDLVKEQAQYMLGLLDSKPRLTVRVLHFDANIPYINSDFTMIANSDRLADTVYVPFGFEGQCVTDRARIKEWTSYWNRARDAALSVADTRNLLEMLADRGHSAVALPDSRRQTS
jgi:transcriptional regulator with XRE-family HTH domain